eukprot:6034_1
MKHRKEDFELGQLLGDGAFAKVVEGTIINEKSPQYGKKYAIKVMDKRHIMKNDKIKYVTIEKKVFLATAPHPFICHLHFTFQDSYSLFMVLDLCNDAELSYEIWKYMGLTEELTVFYVSEIISCLEYMHSKGIYHRDIKPENVLIHNDKHIRLTDFGTAKIINNENENESKNENESINNTIAMEMDNENESLNIQNNNQNNNEQNDFVYQHTIEKKTIAINHKRVSIQFDTITNNNNNNAHTNTQQKQTIGSYWYEGFVKDIQQHCGKFLVEFDDKTAEWYDIRHEHLIN